MQITIEHLSPTKKKIQVLAPAATVDDTLNKTSKKIGANAQIKGFRKGKIPPQMLEKYYGNDIVLEGLNDLINQGYKQAIAEHQLRPVFDPKFDVKPLVKNQDYQFSLEVEVIPPFEVTNYTGIALKKLPNDIADADIQAELVKIQEQKGALKPAEGDVVLTDGLVATIDIEGKIDGQLFEGGSAKGQTLEVGKGQFLKDFEDNARGLKNGQSKTFNLTFPADYHAENLRGKVAEFTISVVGIHQKDLPAIDDELAKDLGYESLAQLKDVIKAGLTQQKDRQNRMVYGEQALKFLQEKITFEVPHGLVHNQLHQHQHNHDQTSAEHHNHTEAELKEAADRVRTELILDYIANKENIRVESQELQARLNELAFTTRQPPQVIEKHFSDQNNLRQLMARMTLEKTINFLVDKANLGS